MESDEHGDFKVRLEMEENGEDLNFLQEIDEDFFLCVIYPKMLSVNNGTQHAASEQLAFRRLVTQE